MKKLLAIIICLTIILAACTPAAVEEVPAETPAAEPAPEPTATSDYNYVLFAPSKDTYQGAHELLEYYNVFSKFDQIVKSANASSEIFYFSAYYSELQNTCNKIDQWASEKDLSKVALIVFDNASLADHLTEKGIKAVYVGMPTYLYNVDEALKNTNCYLTSDIEQVSQDIALEIARASHGKKGTIILNCTNSMLHDFWCAICEVYEELTQQYDLDEVKLELLNLDDTSTYGGVDKFPNPLAYVDLGATSMNWVQNAMNENLITENCHVIDIFKSEDSLRLLEEGIISTIYEPDIEAYYDAAFDAMVKLGNGEPVEQHIKIPFKTIKKDTQ